MENTRTKSKQASQRGKPNLIKGSYHKVSMQTQFWKVFMLTLSTIPFNTWKSPTAPKPRRGKTKSFRSSGFTVPQIRKTLSQIGYQVEQFNYSFSHSLCVKFLQQCGSNSGMLFTDRVGFRTYILNKITGTRTILTR